MKNFNKTIATVIVSVFAFLSISFSSNAQSKSLTYTATVAYLEDQGYTIASEQYANLTEGQTAGHTRTFHEGNKYVIVACSDDSDVNDVDIFLNNTAGSNYTKDTDTKSVAVVEFTPYYTREMKVEIKNYDSSTPNYASRCRFVIAYK